MSAITDNAAADVTENPAGIVTATETNQIKKIRQSPLNITVILPNNRRILIPSVNPSEPTSYLKQTLQEYQESAQYTSYTFETSDQVTISDYIEIANYGPADEEVSTMVVHLVPAQYDVKKSRLQLKRVREMISYPPSTKGAHADSKTVTESPINVVNKEATAASLNVVYPEVDTTEQNEVDPKKEERSLLEPAAAADVIGDKCDISSSAAADSTAAAIDPIAASELPLEGVVEVTIIKSNVSYPAVSSTDNTISADDVKRKEKESALEIVADVSADDANSPSNESKDGNSLEEVVVVVEEEEKPVSVPPKSSIALDDDGIKVTGMDAVEAPEPKQLSKLPEKIKKLPSLKSIFCPVLLSEFFAETLLRVGANDGANNHRKTVESGVDNKEKVKVKSPSECIKSVSASGWNPPPLARKLQGDLLYIEAVTEEGVFHVTSTPKGFFVNRCTRSVFDPRPALHPHFSHELFNTLLDVSSSLRMSWHNLCVNASEVVVEGEGEGREGAEGGGGDECNNEYNGDTSNSGALDVLTALCSQGREDLMFVRAPWNVATPGTFSTPEKNIPQDEKSLKKKKVDEKKKSSAELSKMVARINNTHSAASTNARTDKDRADVVPQYLQHNYDLSRLHDDLCDQFGAEDPGAPREWNEEMQSVRTFKSADISEIVMKAKYIHNIYQEFKDAVRTGALAISDGHIAPMNPLDVEKAHVYVYNNIFYSQAVESKESFKICDGDVASRKLAGHDLKNQKLIQSFDLDGLCTVLSCIVDFKGARLIGQTIIPGVLQVGVHSARLLYGAIERGKRLTVKNEGLKIMNSLFSELFVVERKITATPTFTLSPTGEYGEGIVNPAPLRMDYFGLTEEENQSTSVEIDFEDDVVESTSEVVPHVGCLEIKLLKGTDGRAYVLDAMRLTPIDANYVKGPKSTGNIPVDTLALVNNNVSTSYVLRYELISSYSQHKATMLRQDMIRTELQNHRDKLLKKELAKEKKIKDKLAESDPILATAAATATDKDKDKKKEEDKKNMIAEKEGHEEEKGSVAAAVTAVAAAAVKKDSSSTSISASLRAQAPAFIPSNKDDKNATASKNEIKEGQVKENTDAVKEEKNEVEVKNKSEIEDEDEGEGRDDDEESEEDLINKFDELTHQNLGVTLQLNANCFIDGFECDVDPVVALKDEESARDVAHYLFKQVTVSLTEQIRAGEMSPLDNEGMVELLHTHGVNMRYLGRMAALAHTQETQDLDLLRTHRQRIQSMPLYWLEMIEIEILARCFKHYLNRLYRENKDIRQSPSPTIATLLNHILGTSIASPPTTTSTSTTISTTTTTTSTTTSTTTAATASGAASGAGASASGVISHVSSTESGNDSNMTCSLSSIERKESTDSDKDNSINTKQNINMNMKKKKSKHTHARENCSASIPELIDAGGKRGDCITALGLLAAARFGLLHPSLLNFKTASDRCQDNDKDVGVLVDGGGKEEGDCVDIGEGGVNGVDGAALTESQVEQKEGGEGEATATTAVVAAAATTTAAAAAAAAAAATAAAATAAATAAAVAEEAVKAFKLSSLPFLHDRITRITLLRRLCQIAGLRIISRDYDFTSPHPFSRDDIVSVVPLVKSAQQSGPIPEVSDILNQARGCLEEGNLTGAFELSQDASRLLNQITGPLHKETVMCTNLITQILLEARNNSLALTMAFKSLSISVQLTGLDSQDAAQHHGQVAALLCDLGYPLKALQHFLTMKYLIELMAGPRHPELVNVYLRLVSIYDQQKEYVTAQVLLAAAKELSVDVARQCMISTTVADIYDKMGELTKAVSEQRAVLRTMVQLFGPTDEKSIDAKSKVEKYLRKLTISNVNAARGIGNKNNSNGKGNGNGKDKDKDKVIMKDLEATMKKAMKGEDMNGKNENKDGDYLQIITDEDMKKDEKKKSNNSNKKKNKNKNKK